MHKATIEETACLREFLVQSVTRGVDGIDDVAPRNDVTALMYFFWKVEDAAERWGEFEGALLETWRNCGRLKTVIVTNCKHQCVLGFAKRFANVEVQVEECVGTDDV